MIYKTFDINLRVIFRLQSRNFPRFFNLNNCLSYIFSKHKACAYCVFCALFSHMCLLRQMLRNYFENKPLFLKIMVNFTIIIIFRVNLQVYLQNSLIHNA